MCIQNVTLFNSNSSLSIQLPINSWVEQLIERNDEKDDANLDQLLRSYKGKLEEFLILAMNVKNYRAVHLLIKNGMSLNQPLPNQLDSELQSSFKSKFFENKYYYGGNGSRLFLCTYEKRGRDLAYGIAAHYYPQDASALDILLKHPECITLDVLTVFIEAGDSVAFNKVLPLFLNLSPEKVKDDLLHCALRDFNFSLMGFNYDYILSRLEIIKSILALNPSNRIFDKNLMSTFEIAQYLKTFLPKNAPPEFEVILAKIMEDPTGYHELRGIQRLLINNLAIELNGCYIANYPSVAQHIKHSINSYLQQNNIPDDWIFVTPSKEFTVDKCIELIENKKILKFFTGWTGGDDIGHGINIIVYDHYLCVCNRGNGATETTSGVCLYDIQDKSILKEIIPLFLERSEANEQFITKEILSHPQINLLKHLDFKFQKVGNCVWLSEKIGVLPCIIASYLKKEFSLEDAIDSGFKKYKFWSRLDRINLFKAYLDHPYHYRDTVQNEADGINLRSIFSAVISKDLFSLKPKYYDLMLQKVTDQKLKAFMNKDIHAQLTADVQLARIEFAFRQEEPDDSLTSMVNQLSNVNVTNSIGQSVLHFACQHGRLELVTRLLDKGANANCVFRRKVPLEYLMEKFVDRQNNLSVYPRELIKRLIAATDFNAVAIEESFPLFPAIENGHEFAFDEMMNKGVGLEKVSKEGQTAFHSAIVSKSESIFRKVLNKCSNFNLVKNNGKTLLHLAIEKNILPRVKLLLEWGADPNQQNEHIASLWHIIYSDRELEILKVLIDYGMEINKPICTKYVPLAWHLTLGNSEIVDLLMQNKKIDLDTHGTSILQSAVLSGETNVVKTLLQRGIKPNESHLNIAKRYSKCPEMISLLQEALKD